MSELPTSWTEASLEQMGAWGSGGTPSKSSSDYYHGDIPWAVIGDLNDGPLSSTANHISKLGLANSSAKLIPAGTLLIAMYGSIGKLAVTKIECCTNQAIAFCRVDDDIADKTYLFHALKWARPALTELGQGASQQNISQTILKAFEIPLAPLAEQKQIAAKLDELLAQVDTLKARLDAIPAILKRFRQSVLAAAVSGRLTDGWRGTKAVAFGRSPITINQEFTDAPKNWDWRKLTDLAQLESGHTPRKSVPEYWDNGDTYWISLQDIRAAHGKTITDTKYKTTSLGIKNSSARILPTGTVCFSRDISVGYTTIMGYDMSTTQHFANWICGAKLNNKYLMYSFMAAREHLTISGQGTTVKTIYMPALKELFILTPGVEEQTEIVLRVEQLFAFADQIEQRVRDAQARVNLLTQSILAKAFRGELTADWRAQNVDLISGDNAAEALLARIRAARAEQPKGKRGRRAAGQ